MKIVGFVGMPGSGKSVAADVARDMNIPVFVMGDVIREEAAQRGLDPTDKNLGQVGQQLREKEGSCAVADRCMQKTNSCSSDLVVIEGIRSKVEVDFFKGCCGDFRLIEIWVPNELRLKRIASRGRSDDANEDHLDEAVFKRDSRELGWGMGEAIRSADVRIENVGTMEELKEKVRAFLEGIQTKETS